MIRVRPETSADHEGVYYVNQRAFGQTGEADLVERLRRDAHPHVSLVAEVEDNVVGHILFSPVEIHSGGAPISAMGLGPMAVLPERLRQGIGSKLVREGLHACKQQGVQAVVVLGHPEYYSRFGFQPAEKFGLWCEYDVPREAFMVLELDSGALEDVEGAAKYHAAFGSME